MRNYPPFPLTCRSLSSLTSHSPVKRSQKPDFYGYVPDKANSRAVCFGSLIFISSNMLAIKTLGLVLLSAVPGNNYVAIFLAIDIGLFLLIKIIRGDFIYWLPLKGKTSIIASVFFRIIGKFIGDFTSVVQFRHPSEVGGAQWVLGQVTSVATLFIALHLAEDSDSVNIKKNGNGLWKINYSLAGAAFLGFCVFFSVINKGYINTFFSIETGGQMTIRAFRTLEDEGLKAEAVLTCNESQWESIRDVVKEWVWQSWPRWMEEKPAWFDETMKSMIPVDMIPSLEGQERRATEGVKGEKAKGTQVSTDRRAYQFGRSRKPSLVERFKGSKASAKYAKVAPNEEEEIAREANADKLIAMAKRGSMTG